MKTRKEEIFVLSSEMDRKSEDFRLKVMCSQLPEKDEIVQNMTAKSEFDLGGT